MYTWSTVSNLWCCQDGLSSGHASDMDDAENDVHTSALSNQQQQQQQQQQQPPNLSKRHSNSVSRDNYMHQLEKLNMRNSMQEQMRNNLQEQLNLRSNHQEQLNSRSNHQEQLNSRSNLQDQVNTRNSLQEQLQLNSRNNIQQSPRGLQEQEQLRNSLQEQLNARNSLQEQLNSRTTLQQQQSDNMLANILAMESLSSCLPPPSPAPEHPDQGGHDVAAAIKDIRKALQSTKSLQTGSVNVNPVNNVPLVNDPWLPRSGDMRLSDQPPPPPLPPPPVTSCPPSPACSTPPPPPPVHL